MKAVVLDLVRIRETARDGHAKITRPSLHIAYWPETKLLQRANRHRIMDIQSIITLPNLDELRQLVCCRAMVEHCSPTGVRSRQMPTIFFRTRLRKCHDGGAMVPFQNDLPPLDGSQDPAVVTFAGAQAHDVVGCGVDEYRITVFGAGDDAEKIEWRLCGLGHGRNFMWRDLRRTERRGRRSA